VLKLSGNLFETANTTVIWLVQAFSREWDKNSEKNAAGITIDFCIICVCVRMALATLLTEPLLALSYTYGFIFMRPVDHEMRSFCLTKNYSTFLCMSQHTNSNWIMITKRVHPIRIQLRENVGASRYPGAGRLAERRRLVHSWITKDNPPPTAWQNENGRPASHASAKQNRLSWQPWVELIMESLRQIFSVRSCDEKIGLIWNWHCKVIWIVA
jgi:hypothetical protein